MRWLFKPVDCKRLGLYAVIAGGTILRIHLAYTVNPLVHLFGDSGRHWHNALALIGYDPWVATDPVFYELWLSFIINLTHGGPTGIGIYAGLLSAATPWCWYRFFREWMPTQQTALWGWAVLTWLPSWIGIFNMFMTETVLLPLVGISLWFTWRSQRKKTVESFVWAHLFWLAAICTKPTVVPLGLLSSVWLWSSQPQKIYRAILACLLTLSCLVITAYRTHEIIGVWDPVGCFREHRIYSESGVARMEVHFSRGGRSPAWYWSNSPVNEMMPLAPLSRWRITRTGILEYFIDINRGAEDWKNELKRVKRPLSLRIRNCLENVIFILFSESWPDNNPNYFWERISAKMRWLWAPMLLAVTIGNILWFRKHRTLYLLPWLNLVGWFLICTVPVGVGEGRYRKPFEGLLIANALWLILDKSSDRMRVKRPISVLHFTRP